MTIRPHDMAPLWGRAKHSGMSYKQIAKDPQLNPDDRTWKAVSRAVERLDAKRRNAQEIIATPMTSVSGEEGRAQWEKRLSRLPKIIRFAYISDMHIPDHDERAIDLAAKIVSDYKPHVMQHGSDAFDFRTISRFESDPSEAADDVLEKVATPYAQIMRTMNDAAPGAIKPFLVGNHDVRVYKFMTTRAPQMRNTVSKLFLGMIKEAGGIWMGFDHVGYEIGSLHVIHGRSATKYAAEKHLLLYGQDVVAGHCHRAMTYSKTFDEKVVTSATSGCLCKLHPAYSQYRQAWQHGICFVTVDTKRGINHFENIVFNDYRAAWGGKVYSA